MPHLRRSEWVVVAYLTYTAVVSFVLPVKAPIPAITVAVNAVVIGGFFLLAYAHSFRKPEFLSIMRDWYPVPLMLLCYREMGWFAPEQHTYELEQSWQLWDKTLLNTLGMKAAIESLGPVLPSILEIAYLLVYTIPSFGIAMLYVYHRRERVNGFVYQFLLGILICYTLFPLFPSEPPRTVSRGEALPSYLPISRRSNLWRLAATASIRACFRARMSPERFPSRLE